MNRSGEIKAPCQELQGNMLSITQCHARLLLGLVSLEGSGNQEGRRVHGRPVNSSSPAPLLKDQARSLSESLECGTPSAWTF